ncbi:MAG: hypothetical protein GX442_02490 [Candidatus Riflebacteria bacterium]|nr:hypothetical protein [Candidatus Riflebacteria bacterium]
MGKRLFFLSLIVLSVAMGVNWFKNRPKIKPKPKKAAVAVSLDDLEIASQTTPVASAPGAATAEGSEDAPGAGPGEEQPIDAAASQSAHPEDHAEAVTSAPSHVASDVDPVIQAFTDLPRMPFEPSPFLEMQRVAGTVQQSGTEEEKKVVKTTRIIQAPFMGTIETPTNLMAILDSRLYKAGDTFQDLEIKKIERHLIIMEDASGTVLIPKRGVVVNVASDGTYTYDDTFGKGP